MSIEFNTVRFENISYRLSSGEKLFDNINYVFPQNEIIAIQGARGSGKSILLKLLSGLLETAPEGRYLINDKDVYEMSFEEFLPYRKKIGYSFDYGGLISNKTIFENLMLPLEYHKMNHEIASERVYNYLKQFNLVEVKDERPSSISGGMRKEACVARAFIMEPDILFLDEPTLGMSAANKQKLSLMLYERVQEGIYKSVIIASDDPMIVEGLATKLIYLKNKNLETIV